MNRSSSLGIALTCAFALLLIAFGCSLRPRAETCLIAPPKDYNGDLQTAQKVGADLTALANAPLKANFETEFKLTVDQTFQAIPDRLAGCQMLLQTVACLSQRPGNQASNDRLLAYLQSSDMCGQPHPTMADDVLNFDTVNTYADPGTPVDALSYLGAFGIEVASKTAGTRVVLLNHLGSYEGKAFLPVSQPNVLTQIDSNDPVSFTLIFRRALRKLSFVLPPLIAATTSGITFPEWRVYALDARGTEIASVASDLSGSYIHEDSKGYTLQALPGSGACITSVRFDSDNGHFAAFSAILIDDMALWYAPSNDCL